MYVTVVTPGVVIAGDYDVVVLAYCAQYFQFCLLASCFKGLREMSDGCFLKQNIKLFIFPLNDGLQINRLT